MPQFLIDPTQIQGENIVLTGNEAKHLVKVLRHKVGDTLFLSDGNNQYKAKITDIGFKEATLKILEKHPFVQKAKPPTLAISLLKHDHFELVLQKGVELGVVEFLPFISERTIPHYHESATPKKLERFQKIALEAAKQSGSIAIPKVHALLTWQSLLQNLKDFSDTLLFWEEEEESHSFHSIFKGINPSQLLLIVGPEGGFTELEVRQAEKAGAKRARLGKQILRSETAALATITLCQYELGNI